MIEIAFCKSPNHIRIVVFLFPVSERDIRLCARLYIFGLPILSLLLSRGQACSSSGVKATSRWWRLGTSWFHNRSGVEDAAFYVVMACYIVSAMADKSRCEIWKLISCSVIDERWVISRKAAGEWCAGLMLTTLQQHELLPTWQPILLHCFSP